MTYFRNFSITVCSQLLTRPNNLLLRPCNLPKLLVESSEPSLSHLHTIKALLNTITTLKSYEEKAQGNYQQEVKAELEKLQNYREQYRHFIRRYIQLEGALTGQAIANVYASAATLGFQNTWLEDHLHTQIESKARFMSKANLEDIIQVLTQIHPNCSHLESLKSLHSQKSTEEIDYVSRPGNEINQFEYVSKSKSNNHLIRALQEETTYPVYLGKKYICQIWNQALAYRNQPITYQLHG